MSMSNIEDTVKKVIAGGIGAVATVVEKGSEMAKEFVNKGEETIRSNQGTIDNVKEKIKSVFKGLDVKGMTREERAELRRMLDEADAEDDALDADAEEIADEIEEKAREAEETAETVQQAIDEINEKPGEAAEELGKMADKAADVLSDTAEKLDSVMNRIGDAISDLFKDNTNDPE